jgi:hypothetical protein
MTGFKVWFEAIGFPRNCGEFRNMNAPWFMGAGSDLGCKKKWKMRKLKEELMGNPGTQFPDKSRPKQDGLNKGCGGYVGTCPPSPQPINNKRDNKGCGGGMGGGSCGAIDMKTNNAGCGGYAGKCPEIAPGCSGYVCGKKGGVVGGQVPNSGQQTSGNQTPAVNSHPTANKK